MVDKKINKIKLFIMDVDGVLTDGGMYYSERGEVMKKFNTRDGMGIKILRNNGIIPAIITKEKSKIVLRRAEKLNIKEVYIGAVNKVEIIEKLIRKYKLTFEEVAYVGDDINDLDVLKKAGFSSAPKDALPAVKKVVDYVASRKGGDGAVREIIEFIISKTV